MKNQTIAKITVIILAVFTLSGCSVYMATQQPDKRDLSVLKTGTSRPEVIAGLGAPIHTDKKADSTIDIFKFTQGYSTGVKASRAVFHGAADIATLGLWEALGTPIEGAADGNEVSLIVIYDENDKVKEVKAIKGGEEIHEIAKK